MRGWLQWGLWVCWLGAMAAAHAQVDPERRRLVQVGYNQPVEGRAPFAGYAFYYFNEPGFVRPEWTLRAAVAPVYADVEWAFRGLAGPSTDVAVGVAGGGFADSHAEVRSGRWIQEESFTGHAGELNASVYHLFNPLSEGRTPTTLAEVPLQGIARLSFHDSLFERNSQTASGFVIPEAQPVGVVRLGVRWGGREPLLEPDFAVEASAWYQGQVRLDPQRYGFAGDRDLAPSAHQFLARALVAWTFTNSGQHIELTLTGGEVLNPDRLTAFRLGGTLPLAAEFPLMLPGYYFEELSARRFGLLDGLWSVQVVEGWEVLGYGGTAIMEYAPGMEQAGNWHNGVGGGVGWTARNGSWHVMAGYAYGIDAVREDGRGAHNLGVLVQWDLERGGLPGLPDGARLQTMARKLNPASWRGFNRLFRR